MTYNFDFWMLVITTINVFAALFTWFISHRATKNIFEADSRPIVGIVEFAAHRTEKDELNFMIKYKNFGKTPSRDTKIVFETYLNRKSIAVEQNPIYIFVLSPSEEESYASFILSGKCKETLFQPENTFEISVKILYKGITNIDYKCYERYEYSQNYKQFVMTESSWNK